jgi:hypothetical protein
MVHAVGDYPEGPQLRDWLTAHHGELVTSSLARLETGEQLAELAPERRQAISTLFGTVPEIPISGQSLEVASYVVTVMDPDLALHVGLAASEGSGVAGIVTYNTEVAKGCRLYGLSVISPGRADGWYMENGAAPVTQAAAPAIDETMVLPASAILGEQSMVGSSSAAAISPVGYGDDQGYGQAAGPASPAAIASQYPLRSGRNTAGPARGLPGLAGGSLGAPSSGAQYPIGRPS